MNRALKIAAAIFAILIALVAFYGALTYPRTVLAFSVSFTIGADLERKIFEVPALNDKVQVEVVVSSGSALWTASILNKGNTLWSYFATQGGQTTYNSGPIQISSGNYNFTFVAAGSLSAEITVTSKGGFW